MLRSWLKPLQTSPQLIWAPSTLSNSTVLMHNYKNFKNFSTENSTQDVFNRQSSTFKKESMTSSEESVKADREEVQLNKTEFEKHLPTQTMTASEECVRADREEILKEEEKPTFEAIRTKSAESSG